MDLQENRFSKFLSLSNVQRFPIFPIYHFKHFLFLKIRKYTDELCYPVFTSEKVLIKTVLNLLALVMLLSNELGSTIRIKIL